MNRREFLKLLGLGAVAAVVPATKPRDAPLQATSEGVIDVYVDGRRYYLPMYAADGPGPCVSLMRLQAESAALKWTGAKEEPAIELIARQKEAKQGETLF